MSNIKTKGLKLLDGQTYELIPPSPTETERGGIAAKERTTETVEVAVDSSTGKAYVPKGFSGSWNDLDDRTHWFEEELETIMPEQTVQHGSDIDITESRFYTGYDLVFIVDGVSYRSRAWNDSLGEICYGDSRIRTSFEDDSKLNPEDVPYRAVWWVDESIGLSETIYLQFYFSDSKSHAVEVKRVTNNVQYHPLDENYIPDTIARTSDIPTKTSELTNDSGFITDDEVPEQVQADWNQNDATAADYVKNRPFYTTSTGEVKFLDEKYIPDTIARMSDIQNIDISDIYPPIIFRMVRGQADTIECNMTYEIIDAILTTFGIKVPIVLRIKSYADEYYEEYANEYKCNEYFKSDNQFYRFEFEGGHHVILYESALDYSHTETVDSELSTTSTKPVQNKVITAALNNKVNTDDINSLELITEAEIDAICGSSIVAASDVTF